MKTKLLNTFAAASAVLATLLGTASARAGTITVVNLPATGTDAATGITTNKHYVCAFDFGNNGTTPTINGVPFTHYTPPTGTSATNYVSTTDANFGGTVTLTTPGTNGPVHTTTYNVGRTSSSGQGNLAGQADGNMFTLLTDLIYETGPVDTLGDFFLQDYGGLTIGDQYSLRIYYRYWGNSVGDRQQNFWFNGEGTPQAYSGNPLDQDAGGAHFIEYDFTAAGTDVTCLTTNLVSNGAMMIYGATLEDASYPYAPWITHGPSASRVGSSFTFSVTAIGTPTLAYQWYFNTVSNYTGATMVTDGNGTSGSTTDTLATTNNILDYYFVVVTNNYGSITSAITKANPAPVIVTQPAPAKVGNSVVFSVTAAGAPTLAYQWYLNTVSNYSGATAMTDGSGVSGSTTASVTIANLTAYYFVVVTNAYGSATSQVAWVSAPLVVASAGEPIWNQASQTNIVVLFSDVLDPATATATGNYLLDNGASVNSAALVSSNEVVLATSVLDPMTSYTLTVQNVKDYFGLTVSPSPTSITVGVYPANLALWVRADTGVTTDTDTNTVSQWNDLSGNGNNLFGAPGTFPEPELATNAVGDPVIRFTGTNATTLYANSSSTLAITGDMSIVAVVNFATLDGGTNGEIVSKTAASPNASKPAPYDYYVIATNIGARFYRGNGSAYGQVTASSAPSLGTPHILAVTETGNTVSHFLDGAASGTGILNNSFNETSATDGGQFLFVGTRGDGLYHLTGDLSELIIAGSPLSSYDVASLDSYLITQHHLVFVNTTPTNIMYSVAGDQITLSWPADQIGWQLQSNSVGLTATGSWFPVPGSTATNQIIVTADGTKTNVFYRMVYPAQ